MPETMLAGHCARCLVQLTLDGALNSPAPECSDAPRTAGDFEVLREIGRGGMGVIYCARQISLNRLVALKMILAGEFASEEFVLRFRREANAAASLKHPHIVSIHEIGETGGQPYFSMEYVEGRNLAELLRDETLAPAHEAVYLKQIAEAVHYAHTQGIVHRDLKPSNILIDSSDQPRITDFGLARQIGWDGDLTVTGQALGSPAYMPPEAADGSEDSATPEADIYSLGAILYHMLTGRPPFQGASMSDVLLQARNTDPIPPRRLNPSVPQDLQTICLKCLEKSPARRYASARALAEELGRFLRDEPILARPAGSSERLWRWCRRRPAIAALSAGLMIALLAGFSGVLWQWHRAEDLARAEQIHRLASEESERRTRLHLYAADMMAAGLAIEQGDFGLGRGLLESHLPESGEEDLRGFEWRYLWRRSQGQQSATLNGHNYIVTCAVFSPDGRVLATGSQDQTIKLWNPENHSLIATLPAGGAVWSLAFTPDGTRLMQAGSDHQVKLWDLRTREIAATFPGQSAVLSPVSPIMAIADASLLYWEPAGTVSIWDYEEQRKIGELPEPGKSLGISPDGRVVAVGGRRGGLRLWDLERGEYIKDLETDGQVWSIVFSPSGSQIAAAGRAKVLVWDLAGSPTPARLRHPVNVWAAAFSPDGKTLATGGSDRGLRLWETSSLVLKEILPGHRDEVWAVAWHPEGRMLATGSKDPNVMLWPAEAVSKSADLPHVHWGKPLFSPDGSRMITTSMVGPGQHSFLWDVEGGLALATMTNGPALGFSPDGKQWLRVARQERVLQFWSPEAQRLEKSVPLRSSSPDEDFQHLFVSPDGHFICGIYPSGLAEVFETGAGGLAGAVRGPKPRVRAAALAPGGTHLAVSVEAEYFARLYEVSSAKELRLPGHRDFVSGLDFSPDGKWLATGSVDAAIKIWNVADGTEEATLTGHLEEATDVTFSPDGRTLASVGAHISVKLWHMATFREVLSLALPAAGFHIQFSPDGNNLAVALGDDGNKAVRILKVPRLEDPAEDRP
jgi:eukaryotic-like serine/threonine-protein kinase